MTATDKTDRQQRIEELLSHAAALITTEADEASPWHRSRGVTAPEYRELAEHVRQARLEAERIFDAQEVPVIEPAAPAAGEAPATQTRVRADTLTRGDVVRIHGTDYTVEGLARVWPHLGEVPPNDSDALHVSIDFGASSGSTVEPGFELELVSRQVSDQVAGDVLTGALEGGIGYWSMASEIKRVRDYPEGPEIEGLTDELTVVSVRLEPATNRGLEADEFEPVTVTLDTIRKGLTRTAAETSKVARVHRDAARRLIDRDENDDYDADDADVIVQMAVFGQVVYG